MAKKFFLVCAGIFLLAMSYQVGAMRAEAQASRSNHPLQSIETRTLSVVDEAGNPRIELSAEGGMAYVVLKDKSGVVRTAIASGADGTPLVGLSDADGNTRITLSAGSAISTVTLADGGGTARLQLALAKDFPAVTLMDAEGKMRVSMGVGPNGQGEPTGLVSVFDGSGTSIWRTPR